MSNDTPTVEDITAEIDDLKADLDDKRSELAQLRTERDLEAQQERARELQDEIDGLLDDLQAAERHATWQLKLARGEAYTCDECADFVTKDDSAFGSPPAYEQQGICRSCHQDHQDRENYQRHADLLAGAEVVNFDLDAYEARQTSRLGAVHALVLDTPDSDVQGIEVTAGHRGDIHLQETDAPPEDVRDKSAYTPPPDADDGEKQETTDD